MSTTLLFVLVPWISIILCPTRAQDGGRELYFPTYFFYAEKHLVNHLIKTMIVKDLDECEHRCYLDANCVSLNIKNKYPNGTHKCELNNSTHLEHEGHLKHNQLYYYRGANHNCGNNRRECENNSTCQSGFTQKGYRCFCPAGFEGEHCENDIDECVKAFHKCHENATCNNTEGGYNCSCKDGYTGDGHNCTDINECATQPDPCDADANSKCLNTGGSYSCECNERYVRNGLKCEVDACHDYQNLTDADRKYNYPTNGGAKCDNNLNAWYRFQGAAGTKMVTTCPDVDKCGGNNPAWLSGNHPTVIQGSVSKKVCVRKDTEDGHCCDASFYIQVKNCGPYYIYQFSSEILASIAGCNTRYCSTD